MNPSARSLSGTSTEALTLQPVGDAEGHLRLVVAGEVDMATSGLLEQAIAAALDPHPPARVTVDLGGVTFMDSSGIVVLLHAHRRATALGCPLVVADPQPAVRRVLQITGALAVLGLTD
jgi:anti-anti-sigma factor